MAQGPLLPWSILPRLEPPGPLTTLILCLSPPLLPGERPGLGPRTAGHFFWATVTGPVEVVHAPCALTLIPFSSCGAAPTHPCPVGIIASGFAYSCFSLWRNGRPATEKWHADAGRRRSNRDVSRVAGVLTWSPAFVRSFPLRYCRQRRFSDDATGIVSLEISQRCLVAYRRLFEVIVVNITEVKR